MVQLSGFLVRTPSRDELPTFQKWFSNSGLGTERLIYLGAFGQPVLLPLGAIAARVAAGGTLAHFMIRVKPDARRRRVGTALVSQFYRLALKHAVQRVTLAELVLDQRSDNAFYSAVGMTAERSFRGYASSLTTVATLLDRLMSRLAGHPHFQGANFRAVTPADLQALSAFLATNYNLHADRQIESLQSGYFDLNLTQVGWKNGEIFAAGLVRSKPNETSIFVDLLLTTPEYRRGPTAIALSSAICQAARQRGFVTSVFEADAQFDGFATTLADRLGAVSQSTRFRYSIDATGMRQVLERSSWTGKPSNLP